MNPSRPGQGPSGKPNPATGSKPRQKIGNGGTAGIPTGEQLPQIRMDKVPVVAKGAHGGLLTAQEIPQEIVDLNNKPPTKYTRGRFLGKGGFAKCYEVTSEKFTGALACKIVNKNMLVKSHHRDKMAQEIMIHRTLKHPNIVDFHSYFEDDLFVYIVLEYCEKKSLMELSRRRKIITEPEARYFLQQICEAVMYLHENKKIIHRDLKLGNIFISDMKVKVGDFGLASYLESDGSRKRTLCGTPNYIAPEVLTKTGHGFEVDIWSIGCVLYTLLIGRPPFETDNIRETYRKIKEGDYRLPANRVSTEARNLIRRMLQVDPSKRPSARQILSDDFLWKGFIPEMLPVTALSMAPRFPNAAKCLVQKAVARKPLHEVSPKTAPSVDKAKIYKDDNVNVANPKTDVPVPMDVEAESFNSSNGDGDGNYNPPIVELMESLRSQVQNAVEATGCHKKALDKDDENEVPSLSPMLYIVRWVDYSDKYGFGYQLSDDSIGVSFNDRTKVILYPDGSMTFITKTGEESHHDTKNYPSSWEKKVRLMNHFEQYMSQYLQRPSVPNIANATCSPRVPTLYTWFRTSKSVVMCLQNGIVQINNFRSHRKIIMCPVMGAITIIEHSQPLRTFSLSLLVTHGCTEALKQDLLYSLGKLETICQAAAGSLQPNNDPISRNERCFATAFCEAEDVIITNCCNSNVYVKSEGINSGPLNLAPQQTSTVTVNRDVQPRPRIWGHSGCDDNGNNCDTVEGDVSLAEFHIDPSGWLWYDVSQVDGYNLPLTMEAINPAVGGNCREARCSLNMDANCPQASKINKGGRTVACKNRDRDHPSDYSRAIKAACPGVYSWSADAQDVMRDCLVGNNGLRVTFC